MKELIGAVVVVAIGAYLLCTTVNVTPAKPDEGPRQAPATIAHTASSTARSLTRDDGLIESRWKTGSSDQANSSMTANNFRSSRPGNTPTSGICWTQPSWTTPRWNNAPFAKNSTSIEANEGPASPGSMSARWKSGLNAQANSSVSKSPNPSPGQSPTFDAGSVASRWRTGPK